MSTDDWTPALYTNWVSLIGGPCGGRQAPVRSDLTVVTVAHWPFGEVRYTTHRYERQLFVTPNAPYGAQEHFFWFWSEMPQDERLAIARARL